MERRWWLGEPLRREDIIIVLDLTLYPDFLANLPNAVAASEAS